MAALAVLVHMLRYFGELGPLFRGAQTFYSRYLAHFVTARRKLTLINIVQISFTLVRCPAIPCGDLHQSFTDALFVSVCTLT